MTDESSKPMTDPQDGDAGPRDVILLDVPATDRLRHGSFGPIVQTADGGWRAATQADMDDLPVGEDLTAAEEAEIED